jgi:hypothetical protein
VETHDLSASGTGARAALDSWRGGSPAAQQGWTEAGVRPRPEPVPPAMSGGPTDFSEGMLVRHATHGAGRVTEVRGHGAARRVKVRFTRAGERTFAGLKIALEVVG